MSWPSMMTRLSRNVTIEQYLVVILVHWSAGPTGIFGSKVRLTRALQFFDNYKSGRYPRSLWTVRPLGAEGHTCLFNTPIVSWGLSGTEDYTIVKMMVKALGQLSRDTREMSWYMHHWERDITFTGHWIWSVSAKHYLRFSDQSRI